MAYNLGNMDWLKKLGSLGSLTNTTPTASGMLDANNVSGATGPEIAAGAGGLNMGSNDKFNDIMKNILEKDNQSKIDNTKDPTRLENFGTGVNIGKSFLDAFIGWKTMKLGEESLAFGKQSYADNRRTDLKAFNDKNEANIRADNYRRPDQIAAGVAQPNIEDLIKKTTLT
jgi:hypothetical protein